MKIIIDRSTTVYEIQAEFNRHFKFLKLKFFYISEDHNNLFPKINGEVEAHKKLDELSLEDHSGLINISEHESVIAFENKFEKSFGIKVQVFRKSGNLWLAAVTTGSWTLHDQNKKGEEMERYLTQELVSDYDQYYEQIL